jgi:energy-converting hydrogenase Eha subunit E
MGFCNLIRSFGPIYSEGIMAVAGPAGNDKIEKALNTEHS